MLRFNVPYLSGKELEYIKEAVMSGKISGDGEFSRKCHNFFTEKYGFNRTMLTTSCTDALEMAAILIDLQPGDEVIMPSYTFVSTANAFVLRGAKIIFVDSGKDNPNLDADKIEQVITPRTKAIVPVHYAGIACDMDKIMAIAQKYNLYVIEDAAQAIDSFHNGRPLGSIGHLGAFSFHETKNIISGEGGLLAVNHPPFEKRAEIIREKGTNRNAFFRGEVDKYQWVDIGSSFLPSDVTAAFLYAQLEMLDLIQNKRKEIWDRYHRLLLPLAEKGFIRLPHLPDYATNNAHMFYILCPDGKTRNELLSLFKENKIMAIFHYQSLHASAYYRDKHDGRSLSNSDYYSDCLIRLPLFFELTEGQIDQVVEVLYNYFS